MPEISIIIPVYNTEEYLTDALNSIINQTLKDIEIIIIDDGSTDDSPQIIEQFKNTDTRIKSFRQQNAGQASARNAGLAQAVGKYIYFMDSDDILSLNAMDDCFRKASEQKLDILFFDAVSFSDEGYNTQLYNYIRCNKLIDKVYSGTEIADILLCNEGFRVAPWLQIYNREFLLTHSLKYEHTTHEDELFTILAFLQANRVGFINQTYFHRRLRSDSVVTSHFNMKKLKAYCFIITELKRFSQNKDYETKKLCKQFIGRIIYGVIFKIRELCFRDRISGLRLLASASPQIFSKSILKIISSKIYG